MPKTRLISPGSIPNHKLLKNLQLQDNYISNDGGDEGITIDNDGVVTASSQIDIGNMSLTTSEIDISSGDFTLDVEGDITLDANGSDIMFKDNGVGNIKIDPDGNDITGIQMIEASTNLTIDALGGSVYFQKDGVLGYFSIMNMDDNYQQWLYSALESCKLTVGANGEATFTTNDPDGAVGHLNLKPGGDLNLEPDGHVEFDGCAAGFDKETTLFGAAAVTSEGDDSTDIDFRRGNKHQLGLTDNIGGGSENINMIFPATSGNFLLVLYQDATGGRTVAEDGWKAYASDVSAADNTLSANSTDGDVRWAGGSAPTLSTGTRAVDVVSIYWDADNQTALAVASLAFATP